VADFVEGADGESVLIGYLRNLMGQQPGFESVEVVGAMPSSSRDYEPPAEAVTVRLTGGTPRDVLVDDLQLTITAWAGDGGEVRASGLSGPRNVSATWARRSALRCGSSRCRIWTRTR
jgi:hypothetical protein